MKGKNVLLILGSALLISSGLVSEERFWTNWSFNHERHIKCLFTPSTREEIIELIQTAGLLGKKIKVLGGGHSLSAIALPDEDSWAISLEKYGNILSINKEKLTVTVQAGATLKELNEALAEQGLALINLASTSDQTVGGVIQTGTHATGKDFGPLHTLIVEMTVINGKGEIKTLSANSDPLLFKSYQCGLGSLGIIDSLTFQVLPMFYLHEMTYPSKWPEMLDQVEDLIKNNERFSFYWYPYANCVGIWVAGTSLDHNRKSISKDTSAINRLLREVSLSSKVHSIEDILEIDPIDPVNIARINQALFESNYSETYERCDTNEHILGKPGERSSVYAMEAAISSQHAKPFMLDFQKLLENNHFPTHGAVEVRFVKADEAMLSPSYSKNPDDLFCFVNIVVIRPNGFPVPYQDYFAAFQELVETYQGRLHWGKMGDFDPVYLEKVYPLWNEFRDIQHKEDPSGIFLNELTRKILFKNPA